MNNQVEELRKKLYDDAVTDISELASAWGTSEYLAEHHMKRVAEDLDSLISAVDAVAFARGKAEGAEQMLQKIRTLAYEPNGHWAKDMGYQQGAAVIILKCDLGLNNDGSVLVPKEKP